MSIKEKKKKSPAVRSLRLPDPPYRSNQFKVILFGATRYQNYRTAILFSSPKNPGFGLQGHKLTLTLTLNLS
jgi:hypothetical protein